MNKILLILTLMTSPLVGGGYVTDAGKYVQAEDITYEIPEIKVSKEIKGFERIPNVAQYKEADWSQAVGIARGISLAEAQRIVDEYPEITFFFHMKGFSMVLERQDGTYRYFRKGDTVFFTGEPWWGSAPGYSDGFVRIQD